MIYVERIDDPFFVIFEVSGARDVPFCNTKELPYAVKVARAHGRKVMFADGEAGRAWWNSKFPEQLKISDVVCFNTILDYFGMPRCLDDRDLSQQFEQLPAIPPIMYTYWEMAAWQKSVGKPSAADNAKELEVISYAAAQLCGDRVSGLFGEQAVYGYSADIVQRSFNHAITQADISQWREAHPKLVSFWHQLEMSARVAMDSLAPVKLLDLTLSCVQVTNATTALKIELPDGTAIHYPGAKLRGHALYCRLDRQLSATRLAKHVIDTYALRIVQAYQLQQLTGKSA